MLVPVAPLPWRTSFERLGERQLAGELAVRPVGEIDQRRHDAPVGEMDRPDLLDIDAVVLDLAHP